MTVEKAPIDLAVADRIEVLVLVDNVTDNLSTVPRFVENEMPRLARRGLRLWSGQCMCCAAHGFSCAVTAWHGDVSRTLLFDTGPDDRVFERNVDKHALLLDSQRADFGEGVGMYPYNASRQTVFRVAFECGAVDGYLVADLQLAGLLRKNLSFDL